MKGTTAALAGGAAATIIAWLLSVIWHVTPPADVVSAIQTFETLLFVWIASKPWQIAPVKP